MIQCVVAVFDRAAMIYGRPFFVVAPGQAVRSFTEEVNRRDADRSEFAKHPADFELWSLARYDDATGSFEGEPELLVRAKDVQVKDQ